jgi:peptidoglycan/xylan/chitin deacetylase (PgdA/CDA1 family)
MTGPGRIFGKGGRTSGGGRSPRGPGLFSSIPRGRESLYDIPDDAKLSAVRKAQRSPQEEKRVGIRPVPKPPKGPILGLRVDVDTHDGMRDGVPRLLDVFREAGVHATFYLAFGPDRSGLAVFNVLKNPLFLKKMLRTRAATLYGWRTVLSGTLLPARKVALAFPEVARRIAEEGHEVGVHAWDHRAWQDRLPKFSYDRMAQELERAGEAFVEVFGTKPKTYAAPAWFCSNDSLRYQENLGLDYASDCRGGDPFYPNLEGRTLRTPQVPATLPTLDEALGETAKSAEEFYSSVLASAAGESWPVLTVHAEMEGGPYAGAFSSFLRDARERGIRAVPLRALLAERLEADPDLPHHTLSYGIVEGRASAVSLQFLEV